MPYYVDENRVTIEDLMSRITESDLVPSREVLLDCIEGNFASLKESGISTLADLRQYVKNPKRIGALAQITGIDVEYLTLLRREIESYISKNYPLGSFDWLDTNQIAELESKGFNNSALFFDTFEVRHRREELIASIGLEKSFVEELFALVDLTRIQWVNPTFARVLVDSGYKNAELISTANANDLHEAVQNINSDSQYFKGKIGLRDIKRLIKSATYVIT